MYGKRNRDKLNNERKTRTNTEFDKHITKRTEFRN